MRLGQIFFLILSFSLISVAAALAQPSDAEIASALPVQGQAVNPSEDRTVIELSQTEQQTEDYYGDAEQGEEGGGEEEEGEETAHIADPIYLWNNAMYHFNDKLYFWALKPVAKGYSKVMPEDLRTAVDNFFYNLLTPVRLVADLMQLKMRKAGNEVVRLAYNSTAGVFGLVDAAKADLDIPRHDEDLGQTLGSYGIGHGFYIVWPLIGPSSLRDTVGLFGDGFLTPVNYVSPWTATLGIDATDKVNHTSLHIGEYEDFKESAIDPYVAIRNAYVQHRRKEVEE